MFFLGTVTVLNIALPSFTSSLPFHAMPRTAFLHSRRTHIFRSTPGVHSHHCLCLLLLALLFQARWLSVEAVPCIFGGGFGGRTLSFREEVRLFLCLDLRFSAGRCVMKGLPGAVSTGVYSYRGVDHRERLMRGRSRS
jgi:hypothetical protein